MLSEICFLDFLEFIYLLFNGYHLQMFAVVHRCAQKKRGHSLLVRGIAKRPNTLQGKCPRI